jgi:hypothetical protein
MSESVFKFYPLEPTRGFAAGETDAIIDAICDVNDTSIARDTLKIHEHVGVQFIDCGSALERIKCPLCGAVVPFDAWQTAMDADFTENHGFELRQSVHCACGRDTLLHGLRYDAHCGFSRSWISVVVHSHFWIGCLNEFPWIGHVEARL